MAPANLHGVWAKWERAVEQLAALDKEVAAFCAPQPYPYGIRSYSDPDGGHYRFEIEPAWPPGLVLRWGAIIGEIVHDFRSALDNLVWQLVVLNGGTPYSSHAFPVLTQKPSKGFAVQMRRKWTDKSGRVRHGPLFGLSDEATAIIEACQPYKRQDGILLVRLHALWNIDKHRHLAPVHVEAPPARLIPEDVTVLSRDDRLEGGTYILEVTVPPGTHVDVDPQQPTDITFGEPHPIVLELKRMGQLIIYGALLPAADLFPDLRGVGFPGHDLAPWGSSGPDPG